MTNEKLYEAIGDISDKNIKEAKEIKRTRKNIWFKWGAAAACLSLAAMIVLHGGLNFTPNAPTEEIDPIVADIAVFPENESIENVADVTMKSLSEAEIHNVENLGEYLPDVIPEGYCFSHASLYKTTMKHGSEYYCLRTNYSFDDNSSDNPFEEEILMLDFSVSVTNYKPKTEHNIYTEEMVFDNIAENNIFVFETDEVYIEINSGELTYEEILILIKSI